MSLSAIGLFLLKWVLGPAVPLFAFWQWVFRRSLIHGDPYLPAMLAAAGTLLILGSRSLWRALALQRQLREGDPSRWRDGEDRAFAGRLRSGSVPLIAPVSGEECAFYTWHLFADKAGSRGRPTDFGSAISPNGYALADASLDGMNGAVPVRGQPFLQQFPHRSHTDPEALGRLAQHLWSGKVQLRMFHVETRGLREFSRQIWHDMQHAAPDTHGQLREEGIGARTRGLLGDDLLPWKETRDAIARGNRDAAIDDFVKALQGIGARVEECALPAGTPVVALGRWHRKPGYLTIGPHGKKSLMQTGLIGSDAATFMRGRRGFSVGFLVVAAVIAAAVHVGVFDFMRGAWTPTSFPRDFISFDGLNAARKGLPDALLPLLGPDDRQDALASEQRAQQRKEFEASEFYRTNRLDTNTHPNVLREDIVQAAPEQERLQAMDALLALRSIDLNRNTTNGFSLLMQARGKPLERLLSHGLDVNQPGATPLHAAARKADPERIEMLLRAGADPGRLDEAGWTPLQEAEYYASRSADPREVPHIRQVIALLRAATGDVAASASSR